MLLSHKSYLRILDLQPWLKSQSSAHTSNNLVAGVSSPSIGSTSSSSTTSKKKVCRYYKKPSHLISECYRLQSKQAIGSCHHIPRNAFLRSKPVTVAATCIKGLASCPSLSSIIIFMSDSENLVKQLVDKTSSSLVLSANTSNPTSWYYDSGCCNHMTPNNDVFLTKSKTCHAPIVCTPLFAPWTILLH